MKYLYFPSSLLDIPISNNSKLLWSVLATIKLSSGNAPYPSIDWLASRLSVSKRTIARSLNELKDIGLIDWICRQGTNLYTFYRIESLGSDVNNDLFNNMLFQEGSSSKPNWHSRMVKLALPDGQIGTLRELSKENKLKKSGENIISSETYNFYASKIKATSLSQFPSTGKMLSMLSEHIRLTPIDKQLIEQMDKVEIYILGIAYNELTQSDFLKSMSLTWIIENVEKVIAGQYRSHYQK